MSIEQEIDNIADKMEKSMSQGKTAFEIVKERILSMGPEGLKKALPLLSTEQKELLKSVVEEMKKTALVKGSNDLEPVIDSTVNGDAKAIAKKPRYETSDEEIADEAKKKKQQEIRHQGGVSDGSGLEGQVIGEAPKSSEPPKAPSDVKVPKLMKSEAREEAKEKIMGMEEKEHKTKDPKKLVEAEKKEHKEDKEDEMEKGYEGFKAVEHKVAEEGGASDPAAVAAAIGRKKYGKDKFQEAAAEGKKMKKADDDSEEDGDRLMKKQGTPKGADPKKHEDCVHDVKKQGHDMSSAEAICNASGAGMKKGEDGGLSEASQDKLPDLMKKKKAVKENLKKMISRMQERKMEKSVCVTVLAKNMETSEDKVAHIWDLMAKSESYKYDGGAVGKDPAETSQVDMPEQMKKDLDGKVHDPEDPSNPSYKDKSAKKKGDSGKPMSGESHKTADEGQQPPSTMKKGFWHEEVPVYDGKEGIFKANKFGKNTCYNVDAFIAQDAIDRKTKLAKSTFLDEMSDGEPLAKAMEVMSKEEMKEPKKEEKKEAKKKELDKCDMDEMAKADPAAEAQAQQVKDNAKASAESKKQAREDEKNQRIDEQLTRIEERSGPKMPMVKSVNDLIEKGLTMTESQVEVAKANQARKEQGAFLVKSFSEDDLEDAITRKNTWK